MLPLTSVRFDLYASLLDAVVNALPGATTSWLIATETLEAFSLLDPATPASSELSLSRSITPPGPMEEEQEQEVMCAQAT